MRRQGGRSGPVPADLHPLPYQCLVRASLHAQRRHQPPAVRVVLPLAETQRRPGTLGQQIRPAGLPAVSSATAAASCSAVSVPGPACRAQMPQIWAYSRRSGSGMAIQPVEHVLEHGHEIRRAAWHTRAITRRARSQQGAHVSAGQDAAVKGRLVLCRPAATAGHTEKCQFAR